MSSSYTQKQQNDFSKGSIVQNIVRLAVPMTFAQLINVLYNIIDRMYIWKDTKKCHDGADGTGDLPSGDFYRNCVCQFIRHGRRSPVLD